MIITVKRHRDGSTFDNSMATPVGIVEIHFCTSYTQVRVQEHDDSGDLRISDIICEPLGGKENPVDRIAIKDDDTGEFVAT